MPIPKNWAEELILEWLTLKGYMAQSNVRLKSGRRGGVKEADIIGLRLVKEPREAKGKKMMAEVLEILHVEVGNLTGGFNENFNRVKNKFSRDRIEAVKSFSLDVVELENIPGKFWLGCSRLGVSYVKYMPLYIATYVAEKQANKLKRELNKHGIKFLTLKEALREIMNDIDEWKERQVRKGFRKTKDITLMESLWLLNLIDYMKGEGIISIKEN